VGLSAFIFFKFKTLSYSDISGSTWFLFYLTAMTIVSYFGSFGGKDVFQFGTDFLVIAFVSLISLFLAHLVSIKKSDMEFKIKHYGTVP